jgi:DNA (cytosine-5)-methyltransferase 1
MKIGSLFTGYGGLDMAVEAAFGATTAWVSDIDKGACKIIAHRYPDVPNLGDITKIDWQSVEPVDILTGGFPCQDLSHAGKRAGMADGTRSGLWSYMADAIDQLRPRMVVAENVRGLLSAEALSPVEPCPWCVGDGSDVDLRALGRVLADLADLGYDASWYGLRAADVGAPHGRFRVFVIAYPAGHKGWLQHRDRPQAASDAQRGRRNRRKDELVRLSGQPPRSGPRNLLPAPRTSDTNGAGRHGQGGIDLRTAVSLLPTPSVADAEGGRKSRSGARSDELLLNGIAHENRWREYAAAIYQWEQLTRPAPEPARPNRNGNPQLTAEFDEWMMGLPDGWVTDVPDLTRNEALKACGNGVVPQQAYAALTAMLNAQAVAA